MLPAIAKIWDITGKKIDRDASNFPCLSLNILYDQGYVQGKSEVPNHLGFSQQMKIKHHCNYHSINGMDSSSTM